MDTLGPALESLRDAAVEVLEECGREVGLVTLAPGAEVAWDNCCEGGGELWVRVLDITPMPQGSQPCNITDLRARVGLGIVRCVHGLNDEGAPTSEDMTGDTLTMTADAEALLRAIRGWEGTKQVTLQTLTVESGTPQGPSGYCGGWEWVLTFRYQMCAGC